MPLIVQYRVKRLLSITINSRHCHALLISHCMTVMTGSKDMLIIHRHPPLKSETSNKKPSQEDANNIVAHIVTNRYLFALNAHGDDLQWSYDTIITIILPSILLHLNNSNNKYYGKFQFGQMTNIQLAPLTRKHESIINCKINSRNG